MMKSLACAAIAAAAYAKHNELSTGFLKGAMISNDDMMPIGQLSIMVSHERGAKDVQQSNALKFDILDDDAISVEDDIVFWRYIDVADDWTRFTYD